MQFIKLNSSRHMVNLWLLLAPQSLRAPGSWTATSNHKTEDAGLQLAAELILKASSLFANHSINPLELKYTSDIPEK